MAEGLFDNPNIDWQSCTFDGARLQNHRHFEALSFGEKLAVIEGMNEVVLRMLEYRKHHGLPYIDPYTSEVRRGSKN
jgi:hypothetical protein